ncbi:collagen-like protein [Pseudomonadales bacterium]|nr:collagen-like protein [Pseudomonadales bacterium]
MRTILNRFSKYLIIIFGFLAITLSHAQDERADDISILDVDANGEVDALADGLLLLRSMFGFTGEALVTGAIDLNNCTDCDAEGVESYITSIKGTTLGGLTPEAGPAGPQGEKGDKGDTGPQGEKGDTGAKGDTGSQGIQGIKGDTGSQGIAGTDGAKGDTGATGASGVSGSITELSDALVEDNSIYIGSDPSNQTQTAENNVALGITALDSISIGDGNTAIGASADVGSGDLTNATAIGNGAIVTASNTMQLGNTSVTNVKTSGSVTAGAITIPNTDGSTGQLLATDGSGQLYWLTLVPLTEAQANAITANTAKTGITSSQASAITANTAKVGISDDQVEAINQISVNREILLSLDSLIAHESRVAAAASIANTEILFSHDSAIAANTAKTGITSAQASAITANTAKVGMTLGTTSSTALAGDALSGDVQIGNSASDKIGFFGTTPVNKPSVTDMPAYAGGSAGRAWADEVVEGFDDTRAKINEIINTLEELGLIN